MSGLLGIAGGNPGGVDFSGTDASQWRSLLGLTPLSPNVQPNPAMSGLPTPQQVAMQSLQQGQQAPMAQQPGAMPVWQQSSVHPMDALRAWAGAAGQKNNPQAQAIAAGDPRLTQDALAQMAQGMVTIPGVSADDAREEFMKQMAAANSNRGGGGTG